MEFIGGYNILLQGRPEAAIVKSPEPQVLYLPLMSGRFKFTEILVNNGQKVNCGEILARDPENHSVPLLAPRSGTVRLKDVENHITIDNIAKSDEQAYAAGEKPLHADQKKESVSAKINKLLELGAWEFFCDAYTGQLPKPKGTPQAVIVSTLSLEPFVARGDIQLKEKLIDFTRGLEQLQGLLEYQPIYLIMPAIDSPIVSQIREHIRGHAWAKPVEIPTKYPNDNFNILARKLGLKKDAGPIWSLRTEGVFAVDNVLTLNRPCTSRIISIGGPAVNSPMHIEVMPGYPIQAIKDTYASEANVRLINGGVLTGQSITEQTLGLDSQCRGITILPEHKEREFLGFIRPGAERSSYSGCFLSSLRRKFNEKFNTAVRGELRPCVSCNFCEEVCPAGIMPYLIHKYLYKELLEEAERARVDLCIECGLCSFVCPSKIELLKQFVNAKERIESEKEEIRQEQILQEELLRQEKARRDAAKEQY